MIRKGSQVTWKWSSGIAQGKVLETYDTEVSKNIKGSEIKRKGSSDDKALYIEQSDGDKVLKLESEVEKK
ncbi:hypervirulence associated TUDOR domain-containing protein [Anditalea andensis]|uniref:Hypervirulence associated protein TUDOR domain-containing protein n=1 Tax=Anditalea andensis TaxID=1048983 RepID=A0A074KW57_9BACT|nr:DUF2945 domain-containing protein [Anditalea andensis]KEO73144.1 hypothetical protein EL17_12350 [Anditalea andensis]